MTEYIYVKITVPTDYMEVNPELIYSDFLERPDIW